MLAIYALPVFTSSIWWDFIDLGALRSLKGSLWPLSSICFCSSSLFTQHWCPIAFPSVRDVTSCNVVVLAQCSWVLAWMQHHLIFMSTTPGYVSIPWGKQNLLHFLSVQMVPLWRFLCIWTWCIHIYAILYKPCSSGCRHTGSESMSTFSFPVYLCTCVPVYLWWLIIYLNPFIGHSGICWALKIIVSITCLEWCFWHAVSINVDEHFFKFSIKNFSLLPVFLVLMLLYQLYQFM